MTEHLEQDEMAAEWFALARRLSELSERLDYVPSDILSQTVTDLREAITSAVALFQANGGISLAKRDKLHQVLATQEPASLSPEILKQGLLEGGQQLWAIASLLHIK